MINYNKLLNGEINLKIVGGFFHNYKYLRDKPYYAIFEFLTDENEIFELKITKDHRMIIEEVGWFIPNEI